MTVPVLGVDPGATGGAVLLDRTGTRALAAWRWRPSRSRKTSDLYLQTVVGGQLLEGTSRADGIERVSGQHEVGQALARVALLEPYLLCLEGLFVPRPRQGQPTGKHLGQVRSVLTLAESTGELAGPLRQGATKVLRPTAAQWRHAVLGLHTRTSSDHAEEVALRAMRGRPPLVADLGELVGDPHVAEAACIARWGWLQTKDGQALEAGR